MAGIRLVETYRGCPWASGKASGGPQIPPGVYIGVFAAPELPGLEQGIRVGNMQQVHIEAVPEMVESKEERNQHQRECQIVAGKQQGDAPGGSVIFQSGTPILSQ